MKLKITLKWDKYRYIDKWNKKYIYIWMPPLYAKTDTFRGKLSMRGITLWKLYPLNKGGWLLLGWLIFKKMFVMFVSIYVTSVLPF